MNASTNVDRLPAFNVAEDTIVLNYRAFPRFIFGMFDTLSPNRFHIGSTATQSTHYILYNPVNGALLYDGDGNGRSRRCVCNGCAEPLLTYANFVVEVRFQL